MTRALKILIVEDLPTVAIDLEESLVDMGYEITGNVRNSTQALQAFQLSIPDLVILDIHLKKSELDGIEIATAFNKLFAVPIIYLTAYAGEEVKERAKATRPAYYLIKPANRVQLEVAIDFALYNFTSGKQAQLLHSLEYHPTNSNPFYPKKNFFFIRTTKNRFVRVHIDDLICVKADRSMVLIFTRHGKYVLSANLKNFLQQFPYPSLCRIHNSYVANMDKVLAVDDQFVIFENTPYFPRPKPHLPIGKTYRDKVYTFLNRLQAQ